MPKSIIDIDVNDEKFRDFIDMFEQYKTALGTLPGEWSKSEKSLDSHVSSFVEMTAALMAQAELHRKIDAAEIASAAAQHRANVEKTEEAKKQAAIAEKYRLSVERTSRITKDIRQNTIGIAKEVGNATLSLLKWVGIGGVVSGLLGAGGLYGIDRLAEGAAGNRRLSQGLGTTTGNERAFGVNFGRYVDADPYLANVNQASHDFTQQWKIQAASGLTPGQIKGKDTAEIAAEMLPLMAARFKAGGSTVQAMQAYGMDRFVMLEDLIRYNAGSADEHAKSQAGYQRDRGTFAQDDSVQWHWQDFVTQMDRAGKTIDTVFESGLIPLEPELEQLSNTVAMTIKSLMAEPKLKEWIVDLSHGVHEFGEYLTSDKFQTDIKTFVHGVAGLAEGVMEALRTLGIISRPAPDAATSSNRDILQWNVRHPEQQLPYHPGMSVDDPTAPQDAGKSPNASQPWKWWLPDSYLNHAPGTAPFDNILDGIKDGENSGANDVSPKGAKGVYQFMPDTAKDYGLSDPTNESSSRVAAGKYIKHLMEVFNNNVNQAVAAYNWGEGNLKKDIAAFGDRWREHLPAETSRYVEKVTKTIAQSPATIVIQNNTGGSAIVTGTQLAH